MFSLLSGLWRYLFAKQTVNVLIIGLDNAGKTTFLERLKAIYLSATMAGPDSIPPTIGMNLGKMEIGGVEVIFWDLGGQQTLRSIWDHYFAEADGVVYVLDSADAERFAEAQGALNNVMGHHDLHTATPLMVLANKRDAEGACGTERAGAALGSGDFDSRPCRVEAVSGLTGAGVEGAVTWLVDAASKCKKEREVQGPA